MTSIASCIRITARQSAVWRACAACDELAPLAPEATHCRDCRSAAPHTRRRTARAA